MDLTVVIPVHNEAGGIASLLNELDPVAFMTGIVNLITIQNGERNGRNTIAPSFLADLGELGVSVNGRDCIVFGRGGLATSIIYALAQAGGRVHWLTTHLAPAYHLMQEWAELFPDAPPQAYLLGMIAGVVAKSTAPLIVNATTVGSGEYTGQSLWPYSVEFPAGSFVYDVVYDPPQTKLMTQAEEAGRQTVNGQGLLEQQVQQTVGY